MNVELYIYNIFFGRKILLLSEMNNETWCGDLDFDVSLIIPILTKVVFCVPLHSYSLIKGILITIFLEYKWFYFFLKNCVYMEWFILGRCVYKVFGWLQI